MFDPQKPFLKFTTSNGAMTSFVDNPNEHGYSYLKLVKLSDAHPLIDYGQLQN